MDEQKTLTNCKTKQVRLDELMEELKPFRKIIKYFGNAKSKIMILGEAPMQSHVDSTSNCCFKFDEDTETNAKSGAVLIKVFKALGLRITDYFWDNVYKIPIEKVKNHLAFHDTIEKEIHIVNPHTIILLGNEAYKVVKTLDINVNIDLIKLYHPGFILRGGMTIEKYIESWRKVLK